MFSRLLDVIFPPRSDERLVRDAEIYALSSRIRPRRVITTRPATISLLSFRDPLVRAAVHEAKYHDNRKAQRLLANAFSAHMKQVQNAVVIPLPLSKKRMKERGFNQCERIASLAKVATDTSILIRTRDTGHQTRLSREERLQNVLGAFEAIGVDPRQSYFIFDDVITTGASMQAAIDALTKGGAVSIFPIALAA